MAHFGYDVICGVISRKNKSGWPKNIFLTTLMLGVTMDWCFASCCDTWWSRINCSYDLTNLHVWEPCTLPVLQNERYKYSYTLIRIYNNIKVKLKVYFVFWFAIFPKNVSKKCRILIMFVVHLCILMLIYVCLYCSIIFLTLYHHFNALLWYKYTSYTSKHQKNKHHNVNSINTHWSQISRTLHSRPCGQVQYLKRKPAKYI